MIKNILLLSHMYMSPYFKRESSDWWRKSQTVRTLPKCCSWILEPIVFSSQTHRSTFFCFYIQFSISFCFMFSLFNFNSFKNAIMRIIILLSKAFIEALYSRKVYLHRQNVHDKAVVCLIWFSLDSVRHDFKKKITLD